MYGAYKGSLQKLPLRGAALDFAYHHGAVMSTCLLLTLLTVLAKGALSGSETQQAAVRMEADTVDAG